MLMLGRRLASSAAVRRALVGSHGATLHTAERQFSLVGSHGAAFIGSHGATLRTAYRQLSATAAHEINLPDVHAELSAQHERYEQALATNDVAVLDELFHVHDATLRIGPAEAQYGYNQIASMRASRVAPGPREILSTVVTTYGRDYGTATREFRRPTDPRVGRQSQTWLRTADGWRVVAAHVSWSDAEEEVRQRQLQLTIERTEAACEDAKLHAAGDAAIPCAGDRAFPIKLSDTALYVTDMQGDFLLGDGRIGQHYSAHDMAVMEPVIANATRLVSAARKAGLTIAYGRSHRFGAQVRRDLICSRESDDTYNVLEAIRPRPEDIVVDKCTWGIFASTDLEAQLRRRGIRRLLVIGVATNVCVTNAVFQAVDRFFRVCLVPEACGAFDREWHEQAVGMLNGPQVKSGHSQLVDNTGLYFCETATVADIEATLEKLAAEQSA